MSAYYSAEAKVAYRELQEDVAENERRVAQERQWVKDAQDSLNKQLVWYAESIIKLNDFKVRYDIEAHEASSKNGL